MRSKGKGVVAAGHEATAIAAEQILQEGGNAFDAVVAAHFVACVAEPVLASLGGGGFLVAHDSTGENLVYDFFVQTPIHKVTADNLDFFPIAADFGTAEQEFHIGRGAAATPGSVKGMFTIQRDLCSMPMTELVQPAIELARRGVRINDFQSYIMHIVHPILSATTAARDLFCDKDSGQALTTGTEFSSIQFADCLDVLAQEGDALFYQGEIAQLIATTSRDGGHLRMEDLASYQVHKRRPLSLAYQDHTILSNPPPSSGGILIGFGLQLLQGLLSSYDSPMDSDYLDRLVRVMGQTNKARIDGRLKQGATNEDFRLDESLLSAYREAILGRSASLRGTTHVSVMDGQGNIASLTVSNGEGCGHVIPETGIMLNNMLGEEDLNPDGFQDWRNNERMTSMMAPSILLSNTRRLAIGSGGSNRLRSAILQVIVNLLDFEMPLEQAVSCPRIHYENDLLSIEQGFDSNVLDELLARYPQHHLWPQHNLFFGGTHCVQQDQHGFSGYGDLRRGGHAIVVG